MIALGDQEVVLDSKTERRGWESVFGGDGGRWIGRRREWRGSGGGKEREGKKYNN